jgi:hypothetical protein
LGNNDASHGTTAPVSGVTPNATAIHEVMNSAGGDNFVFRESLGHDVINNFRAGDSHDHDVIQIASSPVADFANLSGHVVGHDTVIDPGPDASITPNGVTTPLPPHDWLIV